MSTIKVDTISTRSGSGAVTVSNNISLATEGQIDINSTNLLVRSTGNKSGLRFDTSAYTPFKNGSAADGTVDLGFSSGRYKDLYLSGGLKIGGTGAANTLDDYEVGTWVPVVKATSGGSAYTYNTHYEFRLPGTGSSTNALPYTKIGNRVFISFAIWWNTSATTRFNINLPFSYDGSAYGVTGSATPYSIANAAGLGILGTTASADSFDTFTLSESGGHGNVPHTGSSEIYYFISFQTP